MAIAAVVAAPDADEGQVPVAFVVPRPGSTVNGPEVTEFLRPRLAVDKIPVRIHVRAQLPQTRAARYPGTTCPRRSLDGLRAIQIS